MISAPVVHQGFWRILFFLGLIALFFVPLVTSAQSVGGGLKPGYASQKAANEELRIFRNARIGELCLRFTLTHVPRKSDKEVVHKGVLWSSWHKDGPIFRIELSAADSSSKPLRLILKGGPSPALWLNDGSNTPLATSNKPFLPGLIFTPLELQMPFAYWTDARYLNTQRFRGRPALIFQMNPPGHFKTAHPEIGFVQLAFDRQFHALMQAVIHDANGKAVRKYEAESFTEVKGVYIPEEMRVLDVASRDKDIFRVTQAAVKAIHDISIFSTTSLDKPATQPVEDDFVKID